MAQIGLIYIGSFEQADTIETNWSAENPGVFLGTHGKTVLKHVTTTVTTPLNDGIAYDDDNSHTPSQITYNLGAGTVTSTQDSVEAYNVTIKLGDGSTVTTRVNVIQLTNGATFINENINGIPLDTLSIQSITVNSLETGNAAGWYTVRSIDSARIVCFARDTHIATPRGEVLVQNLGVGDLVLTQDHGAQALVWRSASVVPTTPETCPVRIAAGALGPALPRSTLYVSGQHRILMPCTKDERDLQVFVAAKKLVGQRGITQNLPSGQLGGVTEYHHIMCARHQVIFANGAACESFFPGPMALAALHPAALMRLQRYFAKARSVPQDIALCRPVLAGKPLKSLLASRTAQGSCMETCA